MSDQAELYRAMGRIESTQVHIIAKLDAIIVDHIQHQKDDRTDFQAIRALLDQKIKDYAATVNGVNSGQDEVIADHATRIDTLESQKDVAKGAGWVIIGLLATFASVIGTAVLSIFNGHITIKLN